MEPLCRLPVIYIRGDTKNDSSGNYSYDKSLFYALKKYPSQKSVVYKPGRVWTFFKKSGFNDYLKALLYLGYFWMSI